MEWWQIVLILLGSAVVGIGGGILLSRLINHFVRKRYIWKREVMPVVEKQKREVASMVKEQSSKKLINMVPLFSRKSITILVIGLAMGALLGMGYWAISPALAEMGTSVQSSNIGQPEDGPYESTVDVRIMSRGTAYTSVKDLQRWGEYYAAKMSSLPFLEFLSQKVAEQAPQYTHSPEELAQMMRIRYDYKSDNPALEITAIGASAQEALFFTNFTSEVIDEYLLLEEHNLRSEEYQNKLEQKESIRVTLLQAQKELASLKLQNGYDLQLNSDYVTLNAKIQALEAELATRARDVATFIADGYTGRDYLDALKAMGRTSSAVSKAKSEMSTLEAQATLDHLEESLAYSKAQTKVENLNKQLDDLDARLTFLAMEDVSGSAMISFHNIEEPSEPIPVPVERVRGRNALMMGAVFGMGGAWILLNRKWLANGMPSSTEALPEEDEEDKA